MSTKKKIAKSNTEDEHRASWETADSTDDVDWTRAERISLPGLKPTLKTISLRLPEMMLAELKVLANKRDVPYQSLLKMFLADRIAEELRLSRPNKAGRPATSKRAR